MGTCLLIPLCEKGDAGGKGGKEGKSEVKGGQGGKRKRRENGEGEDDVLEQEKAGEDGMNEVEPANTEREDGKEDNAEGGGHYIACLFTSIGYGKATADEDTILTSTRTAAEDLKNQLEKLKSEDTQLGEIWAVRINSGLFGIEWAKTKAVLEGVGLEMRVVRPPDQEDGDGETTQQRGQKRGSRGGGSGRGRGGGENKRARGGGRGGGGVGGRGGLDGWLKS